MTSITAVAFLWGAMAFSMPYRLPDAELLHREFELRESGDTIPIP